MRAINLLFPFLAFLTLQGTANAAVYVVNTTNIDAVDANLANANCDYNPAVAGDQCTLRAAIMQANTGPGLDTIVLPVNSNIPLTLPGGGNASSGDLDITSPMIITSVLIGYQQDASNYPLITAQNNNRIFDVSGSGQLDLIGMQLVQGNVSFAAEDGGAIRIAPGAQVSVDTVRFSRNAAVRGGAIFNGGILEVIDSDFERNVAAFEAAALYNSGFATIRRSSIRRIRDESGGANAIFTALSSALTLENTLIDGTDSGAGTTETGGIYIDRPNALTVRNSSLVDFTQSSLLGFVDGNTHIQIHNSSLMGGDSELDCRLMVEEGIVPDIFISYSSVPRDTPCAEPTEGGFNFSVNSSEWLYLGPLQGQPSSFFQFRVPLLNSLLVDSGFPEAGTPAPQQACLTADQRGNMRPQDGNGDGTSRCDIGAIEAAMTQSSTYVVNQFSQDLPDSMPGDDLCDTDPGTPGEQCTLRAAVMEANAKPGPDFIEFVRDPGNNDTLTLTRSGAGDALWGDLDITEQLEITGQTEASRPVTTIIGSMSDRLFDVDLPFGHRARIKSMRLGGGETTGYGGAVRMQSGDRLWVQDVEAFSNHADLGGGAIASLNRPISILGSDIHDNTADNRGSAVYSTGDLTMLRNSVTSNVTAPSAASGTEAVMIDDEGFYYHNITNNTISGNSGGVRVQNVQLLELRANTIVDNNGYGVRGTTAGVLDLITNVVAGNSVADCAISASINTDADHHNLFGDNSCPAGASNLSGNPRLAPQLARPDGSITRIRSLLIDSPLLDAVPAANDDCTRTSSDQQSVSRPIDGDLNGFAACDIGATEMPARSGAAQEFIVNVYDVDELDAVPGDLLCDTSPNVDGEQCTLRAAVMESNALPGADIITVQDQAVQINLTRPALGGPASAAHGDLDLLDAVIVRGPTMTPSGRPVLFSQNEARIFNISAPGDDITIRGLALASGDADGSGGAIRIVNANHVTMDRLLILNNKATAAGGGIAVLGGAATLSKSDVRSNSANQSSNAIHVATELTIEESSLRDNVDPSLGAAMAAGAIEVTPGASLFVRNSTLTNNDGNAISADAATVSTRNTTIVENGGYGIDMLTAAGETLFVHTTLFSENLIGGCRLQGGAAITLTTDRYNLAQDGGCSMNGGASNIITDNAGLGPLEIDPTEWSVFHMPLQGSPAIDNGHPLIAGIGCIATDQGGFGRPVDGDGIGGARCDIGAIEAPQGSDVIFMSDFEFLMD